MHLSYNGIELQLLTLDSVVRESVWSPDGTDLLYVRWKIAASCVYAPGSYLPGVSLAREPSTPAVPTPRETVVVATLSNTGQSSGNPQAGVFSVMGNTVEQDVRGAAFRGNEPPAVSLDFSRASTGPIVTDVHLRNHLFRNRAPLRIWGYTDTGAVRNWLVSPVGAATCDADNGPKVRACNVVAATGAPSNFAVQMEIETCIPPCPLGSDRPLLSHRWQMQHTHNEDHYLTRTVTGQAIFHPGLMDKYAQNPDWFRRELFHVVPLGFSRKLGPITLSPDGCVLQYTYMDSDSTVMFNAGSSGASDIDVKESFTYVQGSGEALLKLGLDVGILKMVGS